MSEQHDGDIDQSTNGTERFNPPVEIVSDPPGYRAKKWPGIVEIRYGEPRSCDCQLIPRHGGPITINPKFIRVAEEDSRSLATDTGSNNVE